MSVPHVQGIGLSMVYICVCMYVSIVTAMCGSSVGTVQFITHYLFPDLSLLSRCSVRGRNSWLLRIRGGGI